MIANNKSSYVLVHHSCFERNVYYCSRKAKNFLRKMVLNFAIKYSNRIVYVSNAGKSSFFNEFRIDERKVKVIYNGISEELIAGGKANAPTFENELRILYIGRLSKVKGVHLLVEAVAKLKDRIPISLKIVGTGDELNSLNELVVRMGVTDLVSFEGANREKDDYYRWANVFIYPSIWQEVFGISIVEAMAYGIPCISNPVGGILEIIQDGKNGFTTEGTDSASLARTITRLYERYQQGALEEMSKCAKETAAQFTVLKTVQMFNEMFREGKI